MTLPAAPPRYKSYRDIVAPLKQDVSGWAAFAVQKVVGVVADGVWGPVTDQAVRQWQKNRKLAADGIAGPVTQQFILNDYGAQADEAHGLPIGVGYGFAFSEGGGVLAATNWQVAGGVDCGPAQWRCSGPPFHSGDLKFAFDAKKALDGACGRLADARRDYRQRNSHLTAGQALRVAVLHHNWVVGADSIVRTYPGGGEWWKYVPQPDKKAGAGEAWPPAGFTRAEWAREYPGRVLKFVA